MNLASLITYTKKHAEFDQSLFHGESPSDADATELLNWAQRLISRRLKLFSPSLPITLVNGTQSYDLRSASVTRPVVKVHRAILNGSPLTNPTGNYGLWTYAEIEAENPTWRAATSGIPTAAFVTNQTIHFWLKPNATAAAYSNNCLAAQHLAQDLASGSFETPEILTELHESIAVLAAFLGSRPTATEEEMWKRLSEYSQNAVDLMDEVARQNLETIAQL
ncbi:MAG TPA: hypothetical protein PKA27_02335 [Fimbriimonadaceae bacterium]|nr:hypothetical protein [Fimbriimonadaceae bacterium]